MSHLKRGRDFGTSFEQQLKAFKPVTVNPFTKMLYAARSSHTEISAGVPNEAFTAATGTGRQSVAAAEPFTCCTHCGCGLSELQVQQCHACKNVYCSGCSVANYDAREDRVFCLDCHPHHVAICSDHDDASMFEPYDSTQLDGMALDRSPGSSRDISRLCNSRTNLMQACSRAAAAAASTAAPGNSPFGCFGSYQENCGLFGSSGFGYSQAPGQGSGWSDSTAVAGAVVPGSAAVGSSWRGANARGFGFSRENVLGGWDLNSPPSLGKAGAGQLHATSPVIPFVGIEGYCLASRALEAAVTDC